MKSGWKEIVTEKFDGAAGHYDRHNDVQARAAGKLASMLPAMKAPRVLEIGCGTGTFTSRLFDKYPDGDFLITDISPRMVTHCRTLLGAPDDVEWGIMDGENPDCRETFDLIVSNMTFQWFEDPRGSVERLRACLKPEGKILYAVPGPESFKEWKAVLSALELPSGILNFTPAGNIIKEEEHIAHYKNALGFLRSMKAIGGSTPNPGYKPLSTGDLRRACAQFDREYQGRVSWHILYGSLA